MPRYHVAREKRIDGDTWILDSLNDSVRQRVVNSPEAEYIVDFLNQEVISWETAVVLAQGQSFAGWVSSDANSLFNMILAKLKMMEDREVIVITAIENLINKVTDLEKLVYGNYGISPDNADMKEILIQQVQAKADLLKGFKK